MSTPIPQTSDRAKVPVDLRFDLNTSRITIGEKYTNVRIPIDVWNDEVELEQKSLIHWTRKLIRKRWPNG